MVLPFYIFRGFAVIEFAVEVTPVSYISIVGRFLPFDVDKFVFGVGNRRERFFYQFLDSITILFCFLVEYLEGSIVK